MGSIADQFALAWRKYVVDGVASSGINQPDKEEIVPIGPLIEEAIANVGLGSMLSVTYDTRANLAADLAHDADSVALVWGDDPDDRNDLYIKTGASGSGSWTATTVLHDIVDAIIAGDVAAVTTAKDDAEAARDLAVEAAKARVAMIIDPSVEVAFVASTRQGGLDATVAGEHFAIVQLGGTGCYIYHNIDGTSAEFVECCHYGDYQSAKVEALARELMKDAPPAVRFFLNAEAGRRFDDMFMPSVLPGAVDPTLSLNPFPIGSFAEKAGSPGAVIDYPAAGIVDSSGGDRAGTATFNHDNDIHAMFDSLPAGDYKIVAWLKHVSGDFDYRLGSLASHADITVTGSWALYTADVAHTGSGELGVIGGDSSSGQSSVVAYHLIAVYDARYCGDVFPTVEEELAAMQSGHGMPAGSFPGAIDFRQGRGAWMEGQKPIVIPLGPDYETTDGGFTMGITVDLDAVPSAGGPASALSFFYESSAMARNSDGQIGISSRDDSFGCPYFTDAAGTGIAKARTYTPRKGSVTIFYRQKAGGGAGGWVNGREVAVSSNDSDLGLDAIRAFIAGAYNGTLDGDHTANALAAGINSVWFADEALSDAEMIDMDRAMLRIAKEGGAKIDRFNSVRVRGDSLFDGGEAPNILSGFPELRMDMSNNSLGGSDLNSWDSTYLPDEQRFLWQASQTFDNNFLWFHPGNAGQGSNTYDWSGDGIAFSHTYEFTYQGEVTTYRQKLIDYIRALKRADPSYKPVFFTPPPIAQASGMNGLAWSEASLNRELARLAFIDDVVENMDEFGFVAVVHMGRGTKRLTGYDPVTFVPTFVDEVAGGSIMGDYASAAAAASHNRPIAAAVTLSAVSGSSFTATAPAGTFTYQDVARKITGDGGNARIESINADGSEATLSTDGFVPTARANEPASFIDDFTILRSAFGGTSYSSGQLSVEADTGNPLAGGGTGGYWLGDTLHHDRPGARLQAETSSPEIEAIHSGTHF